MSIFFKPYDIFLSFADEDKKTIAEPLFDALESQGLNVWFSGQQLTIGDSIMEKVNKGLSKSKFGLVLLSPDYLGKTWPMSELEALYARYTQSGKKVILPVWHRIEYREVLDKAPLIAGMFAYSTENNINYLVSKILEAINIGSSDPRNTLPKEVTIGEIIFRLIPYFGKHAVSLPVLGYYLSTTILTAKSFPKPNKISLTPNDCELFIEDVLVNKHKYQLRLPTQAEIQTAYDQRDNLTMDFSSVEGRTSHFFELCKEGHKYSLWSPSGSINIQPGQKEKYAGFRICLEVQKGMSFVKTSIHPPTVIKNVKPRFSRSELGRWRMMVSQAKTLEAMKEVFSQSSRKMNPYQNELILLMNRLQAVEHKVRMGTIDQQTSWFEANRVSKAFLEILGDLENQISTDL